MANKKKSMKKGLSDYYDMRRAYVADKGKAPPKGTKKSDLEAMGYGKAKKKSSVKKRKKRKSSGNKKTTSGQIDWTHVFW